MGQAGALQARLAQIHAAQVGAAEIGIAEVDAGGIQQTQVEAAEVAAGQVDPAVGRLLSVEAFDVFGVEQLVERRVEPDGASSWAASCAEGSP